MAKNAAFNDATRKQFEAFYRKCGAEDPASMVDMCLVACTIRAVIRDNRISEKKAMHAMNLTPLDYYRLDAGDFGCFQKGDLNKCLRLLRKSVAARQ